MPIIKSAKKRMRQTAKNRARNIQVKKTLKQATKDLQAKIEAHDVKKAEEALKKVFSALDTAAKKNVIHKNKVARKKSAYNSLVKKLSGGKKASVTSTKAKAQGTKTKAPTKKTKTSPTKAAAK